MLQELLMISELSSILTSASADVVNVQSTPITKSTFLTNRTEGRVDLFS